jgi:uncharacterized protein (TIGR03083 family)
VTDTAVQSPRFSDVLAALRSSHDRLVAALAPLSDEEVASGSYCTDWTIAQVASHLGSGSEIFWLYVDAGLRQVPAPGIEQIQPIWDRWNAKTPRDQVRDVVPADAAFIDGLDALSDLQREGWQLTLFGAERSLADLARMRLSEHAVHTWDIAVALDPEATVADDAVALLIDTLPALIEFVGKPDTTEPVSVRMATTGSPEREYTLHLSDAGARLQPANGAADATPVLRLPAEALLRLVYGRLDSDHTPASVDAGGLPLDSLRRAFPGF